MHDPRVSSIAVLLTALSLCACATTAAQAPTIAISAAGSAPVLQSITLRHGVRIGTGAVFDVVPDYHFVDADGDVVRIMREMIDTDGSISPVKYPPSLPVFTPASVQKKGAVFNAGGWICGTAQYYMKFRTWLVDAAGNESNRLEYTYNCNGS